MEKNKKIIVIIVIVILLILLIGVLSYLKFVQEKPKPVEAPVEEGPEIKPLSEEVIKGLTVPDPEKEITPLSEEAIKGLTVPE